MNGLVGAGVVVWLVVLFIAILWILMPFAIFGTKPLLRELLAEQKKTNKLLEERAQLAKPPAGTRLDPTLAPPQG